MHWRKHSNISYQIKPQENQNHIYFEKKMKKNKQKQNTTTFLFLMQVRNKIINKHSPKNIQKHEKNKKLSLKIKFLPLQKSH